MTERGPLFEFLHRKEEMTDKAETLGVYRDAINRMLVGLDDLMAPDYRGPLEQAEMRLEDALKFICDELATDETPLAEQLVRALRETDQRNFVL